MVGDWPVELAAHTRSSVSQDVGEEGARLPVTVVGTSEPCCFVIPNRIQSLIQTEL